MLFIYFCIGIVLIFMTIFADEEKENRSTKLMGNPANYQSQCDFMSHYYDFV